MISALFLNRADNVPFERVYKTRRGFATGVKNMKHAHFKWAIDYDAAKIIYPEQLRECRNAG